MSDILLDSSRNDRVSNELPRVVHWPTNADAAYHCGRICGPVGSPQTAVVIGLVGAALLSSSMTSRLFNVKPSDFV